MKGGCFTMPKKLNSSTLKDEVVSAEEIIHSYQSGIGKNALAQRPDGKGEIRVDLSAVSYYKDCSNGAFLNPAIYDYVEDAISLLDRHRQLAIRWHFRSETSPEEMKRVEAIFQVHYAKILRQIRSKLQKELILAILFIFLGFVFLAVHIFYIKANEYSIYGEILDILGWVLIWQAGSLLFLNSIDNESDIRRDLAFLHAEMIEEKEPSKQPEERGDGIQ